MTWHRSSQDVLINMLSKEIPVYPQELLGSPLPEVERPQLWQLFFKPPAQNEVVLFAALLETWARDS